MSANEKLLDVDHVTVSFHIGSFLAGGQLVAVNDVTFALYADKPEIYSIAGESGSGKTTLANVLLHDLEPTEGKVTFEGRDLSTLKSRRDSMQFMAKVQPVFQNPFETFSPLRRVRSIWSKRRCGSVERRTVVMRRKWLTRRCTRWACRSPR